MSRVLDDYDFVYEFELDERVSFLHEGHRLRGRVVRVYNTRTLYHVIGDDGLRYVVDTTCDEMRRA